MSRRRERGLESVVGAEKNFKLVGEKRKLESENYNLEGEKRRFQCELRNFKADFAKVVADKEEAVDQKELAEQTLLKVNAELDKKKMGDGSATNIHKVMRLKAEKERDMIKENKKKLEYMIADLLKQKEVTKEKMMRSELL